jgi:hypothetical protein
MKTKELIEILKLLPDDADVFIRTNENDFSSLLGRRHIKIFQITDKRAGETHIVGLGVNLTAYLESGVTE